MSHHNTLLPNNTLTLVAKMAFVQARGNLDTTSMQDFF
jgi:hypothetical protein